jgi:hypothetical protein
MEYNRNDIKKTKKKTRGDFDVFALYQFNILILNNLIEFLHIGRVLRV